ncbi:helix-turn-helix transcriptional regulator [Marinobacter mobilis]|uniref:helix-turn-helix transcriptional regulator n=1 Tax=Marinobacter mobilis TaxID=488533 RepID=UPI0035C69E49
MTQPQGRLYLWPDHWQLVGHLVANKTHRHISASLLLGLDGPFRLECQGRWRTTRAAIVAPDVAQALDPAHTRVWAVQLDPDSAHWLQLKPLLKGSDSVDLTLPPEAFSMTEEGDCRAMAERLEHLLALLSATPASLDDRVISCCRYLRETLPDKLDLAALAARVNLSSSRLTHLFRAELGVAPRRFLLHLKMNRALAHWQRGKSVSQLAVEAGFYDQPHLVRTARDMFDALPSVYVSEQGFQLCRCFLLPDFPA